MARVCMVRMRRRARCRLRIERPLLVPPEPFRLSLLTHMPDVLTCTDRPSTWFQDFGTRPNENLSVYKLRLAAQLRTGDSCISHPSSRLWYQAATLLI